MELRIGSFGRIIVAGTALALVGCSGGSTGGDSDPVGSEGAYVPGSSSGSVTLKLNETSIPVASTSGFEVVVKGQDGSAASNVAISCDSEEGVAIIEPTNGRETTSSSGSISGVIGCSLPGSFRFACWGPSLNRISNVYVKCTGDIPSGFTGFTGAAGGNLGGGVATPADPGGSAGGSVEALTLISNVSVFGVGSSSESLLTIDVTAGTCDSGDEPFGPDRVEFSLINNGASRVTCSGWSMVVPAPWPADNSLGDYESPVFGSSVLIDPNGGTGTMSGLMTEGYNGEKYFAGSDITASILAIPGTTGSRSVEFTLYCSGNGKSFTKTISKSYSFGFYDNCSN